MENEDCFDLNQVPLCLFSLIMEKISYKDYANFNSCSKFTSHVCNFNFRTVKHYFNVIDVSFSKDEALFFNGTIKPLNLVPENVRIGCIDMHIRSPIRAEYCVDMVRKYRITTKKLEVLCYFDTDILRQIFEVVNPSYFICDAYSAFLELDEVQTVNSLQVRSVHNTVDDFVVLTLKSPCLWILEKSAITTVGIIAFIQQWISYERQISHVVTVFHEFDMDKMKTELEGHWCNFGEDRNFLGICRTRDHSDCILFRRCETSVAFDTRCQCPKKIKHKE